MIHRFFNKAKFPPGASDAIMLDFRDFRAELDEEAVERSQSNPDETMPGEDET